MQNTRLNSIVNTVGSQFGEWLSNPWRRLSMIIISLLFGVYVGTAITTIAGQSAQWDISVAALLVIFIELSSRFYYRSNRQGGRRSLWIEMLNALKVGLVYDLSIEALKLGS